MKIIDCFMYFDEDMLLDLRLNILNDYVDKFIICEAKYNHKGLPKKLNFDIEKFKKFKDKIIYISLEEEPSNLQEIHGIETDHEKNTKILHNSISRDIFQRNFLMTKINEFDENDLILISDLDEIPNLQNLNIKKINIFCQKMFYYKLNLLYPNFTWYGTKACKKKYLINPQWLRSMRSKKYSFWRIDAYFSNKKYININFIKNGGWHFTNIKTPEDIHFKMLNFAHYLEYEKSKITLDDLKKKINNHEVLYDHSLDKSDQNKWKSGSKLDVLDDSLLPLYVKNNKDKYSEWLAKDKV